MRVLIFTEGGSQSGLGHISRCCSLYDELEARGINVEFIIFGDIYVSEVLGNRKYKFFNWTEFENIKRIDLTGKFCIIDSYKASGDLYYYIANQSNRVLYIDDFNRLEYPKGIVVNPSIYTDEHNYPTNKDIKYLLGKDYIILRESFKNRNLKLINQEVKKVIVTLGGSDIRNLTPKILEVLQNYPKIIKSVVIGKGFTNIDEIKGKSDFNTKFFYNLNDEEMKSIMDDSDIAITAAGQTVYELISIGTPFIPIQVIDNQEFTIKGLIKYNLVNRILHWETEEFEKELLNEFNFLQNAGKRLTLYNNCNNFIDTLGVKRIISELIEGAQN